MKYDENTPPTMTQVLDLLDEVIAEVGPDYVYPEDHKRSLPPGGGPGCMYVHDGQYDCIAARVFGKLGVPVETLADKEGVAAYQVMQTLWPDADTDAANLLNKAQMEQDSYGSDTWGQIVTNAHTWAEARS